MARGFHLSVVSPDRSVVDEEVGYVIAPGAEGYFGLLRGHIPIVLGLKPGILEYESSEGVRHRLALGGGYLEMTGQKATVLADAAERAAEIDLTRAEQALERARAALRGEDFETNREDAMAALERAMNRIKVSQQAPRPG